MTGETKPKAFGSPSRIDLDPSRLTHLENNALSRLSAMRAERDVKLGPTPQEGSGSLPPTRAALVAAINDTVLAEDLDSFGSTEEVDEVLRRCAMVMVGGTRRLRLTDAARGEVLRAAWDGKPLRLLLDQGAAENEVAIHDEQGDAGGEAGESSEAVGDGVPSEARRTNAWLRSFLQDTSRERAARVLETARPAALRAATTALERLWPIRQAPASVTGGEGTAGGINVPLPRPQDVRRLLELAELLEPLRLLIGATGAAGRDRFVGRERELRDLRAFVDALASQTLSEGMQRGFRRALDYISGAVTARRARVLVIEARGGLGKTALIAKFVLDHALAAPGVPFAYLDFDRGALQPRDPSLLLSEVARQIALQFPVLEEPLAALRLGLRSRLPDHSDAAASDPYVQFRDLVRGHLTGGSRAVLLVMDTFEVVQFEPAAIEGVIGFLDLLVRDGFPELRVVVSGRADIPDLRVGTEGRAEREHYRLRALTPSDASDMASRLGRELLGAASWKPSWSRAIAGGPSASEAQREPLTIAVAVDLLSAGKDDAERERIAAEIQSSAARGGDIVARLFQKRLIEHIRDRDARKLAWPGLVLRRLTRQLSEEVLAGPCGLEPHRAAEAFEILGREIWLVQSDGDALRHRPDLRSRMMPAMREYRREEDDKPGQLFRQVNGAAIAWFGERKDLSSAYRAEWIYHRLLDGEPPEDMHGDWTEEVSAFLAGADEDFEPGSRQQAFLLGHGSSSPLPATRLAELPPLLAMEHLARTAPDLASLVDSRLHARLLNLRLPDLLNAPLTSTAQAAACALAVKTGAWRLPIRPGAEPGQWWEEQLVAQRYLRARTLPARPPLLALRLAEGDALTSPHALLHALPQDMAAAKLWGVPGFREADEALAKLLRSRSIRFRRQDGAALRLAMLFGQQSFRAATRAWRSGVTSLWWGSSAPTLSASEARALYDFIPMPTGRGKQSARMQEVADQARRMAYEGPNRIQAPAIGTILQSVLSNFNIREEGLGYGTHEAVRAFAAARDEEWVTPLAYAASRTDSPKIGTKLLKFLEFHDAADEAIRASKGAAGGDILQMLRRADEGGFLREALVHIGEEIPAETDFGFLLEQHAAWRSAIEGYLQDLRLEEPEDAGPMLKEADSSPEDEAS
ncbi:hypothetical protein E0493_22005 [Roseomonas sp. M0104]|uniref:Orc1-like AAA ATPase domain-containing protein n=1 Tax=Teichococcus coralli TaxID=2545983 RepID=A0A845BLK9_9PROT|nr:ATP-binding protein [Pseudoroseomonas coralli]MXP66022.1 hypothetical protein [Pseudoroseomonas coralli]